MGENTKYSKKSFSLRGVLLPDLANKYFKIDINSYSLMGYFITNGENHESISIICWWKQ